MLGRSLSKSKKPVHAFFLPRSHGRECGMEILHLLQIACRVGCVDNRDMKGPGLKAFKLHLPIQPSNQAKQNRTNYGFQ